jgi:hypothetical protein
VYKRVASTRLTDDERVEISCDHLKDLLTMGPKESNRYEDADGSDSDQSTEQIKSLEIDLA